MLMSSYLLRDLLFLLPFLAVLATAATATTVATEKYCKCPSSTGYVCRVTKKDSEYLSCDIIDGTPFSFLRRKPCQKPCVYDTCECREKGSSSHQSRLSSR